MAITVIGADWLVDGATGLARMIDIPEAIIGLSIVAIGTSAPELVTTIVATLRDERDVAIGNLLGSSIYNILLVLGLAALAAPTGLTVTRQLQLFDIPLMTLVALACVPVFLTGRRISRLEGGLGVSAYMIYLIWLVLFRA
jgi:cation:H+ antiporter